MDEKARPSRKEDGRPATKGSGRLPYERPAIRWEDDLGERPGLTSACNKTAPLVGSCDTGSLQS